MSVRPVGDSEQMASGGEFSETLRTPWWWYLGAAAVAIVLGGEFAFAVSGWITWVPLLILLPACLVGVWRLSAAKIVIHDGHLEVPAGRVAIASVDAAIGLSSTELRRLVGRHSDPSAATFIRSWIGPGVQLVVKRSPEPSAEPDEGSRPGRSPDLAAFDEVGRPRDVPVPYWVISTRHPQELLSALRGYGVAVY